MTSMDCAELAEVAPELALEVLDARERSAALVHLDVSGARASCERRVPRPVVGIAHLTVAI